MADPIDELRETLAATPPPPWELEPYLAKVHSAAYTVTEDDVERLRTAGLAEDEVFEQTVAAAIGEGLRRLDAALGAIG